jgi:hypothetical protein
MFQKMVNSVLSGLTGRCYFVYLDDIVVCTSEHDTKLREVLDRLWKYKLKLEPEKYEFFRKEVIWVTK